MTNPLIPVDLDDDARAARMMRLLPEDARDAAIADSAAVLDLRPKLRQKALELAYKKPMKPAPGGVA